ncbi:MAG: hypothetical protein WCK65_03460 [Rhodospirillaceae bacterium]
MSIKADSKAVVAATMRRLVLAMLIAALGLLPIISTAVRAQPPAASESGCHGPLYPAVLGFGAITGVAVYNMAVHGLPGVPFLAPAVTTGAMITARAIAENRVYTVISAVIGAWVLNWLYGN